MLNSGASCSLQFTADPEFSSNPPSVACGKDSRAISKSPSNSYSLRKAAMRWVVLVPMIQQPQGTNTETLNRFLTPLNFRTSFRVKFKE